MGLDEVSIYPWGDQNIIKYSYIVFVVLQIIYFLLSVREIKKMNNCKKDFSRSNSSPLHQSKIFNFSIIYYKQRFSVKADVES